MVRTIDPGKCFADEVEVGFGLFGWNVLPTGVVGDVVADVTDGPKDGADGIRVGKLVLKQIGPVSFHQIGDEPDFDAARHITAVFPHIVGKSLPLPIRERVGDRLFQS